MGWTLDCQFVGCRAKPEKSLHPSSPSRPVDTARKPTTKGGRGCIQLYQLRRYIRLVPDMRSAQRNVTAREDERGVECALPAYPRHRLDRMHGHAPSRVSHALARLRDQLGDPLLVKIGSGMAPSPFAQDLVEQVALILRSIQVQLGER